MQQVISLSPTMTRRRGYNHPLMDKADGMKRRPRDCNTVNELVEAELWRVKDIVSRFLAHWPESRRFIDDIVSVGCQALQESAIAHSQDWEPNKVQRFIIGRINDYMNEARFTFGACRATNENRLAEGKPMEGVQALSYRDTWIGVLDEGTCQVDLDDFVEALQGYEKEAVQEVLNGDWPVDMRTSKNKEAYKILSRFLDK